MGTPSPDWRVPTHLLRAVFLAVSLLSANSQRPRGNSASCLSAPASTSCLGYLFIFESRGSQQAQLNLLLISCY